MVRKERSNNSLCEKSMEMVVNIIKLSSLSIAKMSLGTTGSSSVVTRSLATVPGSVMDANELLLAQVPGSQRLQEPLSSSKTVSFVMHPGGGNGDSYVIQKESSSIIDEITSDYIRKVHEKNRNHVQETLKHSPLILPPPSPRVQK